MVYQLTDPCIVPKVMKRHVDQTVRNGGKRPVPHSPPLPLSFLPFSSFLFSLSFPCFFYPQQTERETKRERDAEIELREKPGCRDNPRRREMMLRDPARERE
jgi:hypothetical protein